MVLLCVNHFRNSRFCSLSALLTQILCRQAGHPEKRISCLKATNYAPPRASRPVLFWSNGRTVCLHISPRPSAPPVLLSQCGHHFHTSAPVRALPSPLLSLMLKPLQRVYNTGQTLQPSSLCRSIRNKWVALPANWRLLRRLMPKWVRRHRWHLAGAGVAMALFLLTHLEKTPVTGRTRLLVFSRGTFMELAAVTSEKYMKKFAKELVPVTDPRHQEVERVVQHLAQSNHDIPEVSEFTWSIHVVRCPHVNAFVLPNGKVFIFTGMLDAVADVHQLTIILGHEMAHAVLSHSQEKASLFVVLHFLSVPLLIATWVVCPGSTVAILGEWVQRKLSQLIFKLPFSRKLEAEADRVGLQLAAKACADVRAGPVFWKQMEIKSQLTGKPTSHEWRSTHPSHKNRITQLDRLIPQALELRESCVCPDLPPTDPRSVFFESVHELLETTKHQWRDGPGGAHKPHSPV